MNCFIEALQNDYYPTHSAPPSPAAPSAHVCRESQSFCSTVPPVQDRKAVPAGPQQIDAPKTFGIQVSSLRMSQSTKSATETAANDARMMSSDLIVNAENPVRKWNRRNRKKRRGSGKESLCDTTLIRCIPAKSTPSFDTTMLVSTRLFNRTPGKYYNPQTSSDPRN